MESCPQWHHRIWRSCQLEDVHNKDLLKLQKSITLKRIIQFCSNFYCNVFLVLSIPWKHVNVWVSLYFKGTGEECWLVQKNKDNESIVHQFPRSCMENHLWKFQPKRIHISWDINENINKENKKKSGFGEALL